MLIWNISSKDQDLNVFLSTCHTGACFGQFPFVIQPDEDSKQINIRYTHKFGSSKQNDVKFITIYDNSTYF